MINIRFSESFRRELKQLVKKYASILEDLQNLVEEIRIQSHLGTPIGQGCYKIRLAIKSKGKGKSGGARIITCVVVKREEVILLSIYDKSEQSDISDALLSQLLKENELDQ